MIHEEFLKALEALENGRDLVEFHTQQVTAEKTRGIEERRKANAEAQGFRRFKIGFEKLGWDGESELDDFIGTIKQTVEGTGVQTSTELADVTKSLNRLKSDFEKTQKELATEKSEREKLQTQNRNKTIESKLTNLNDEFYGAQYLIKSLIADQTVDLDETGELIYKKGDQVLTKEDGLKWLQETNSGNRKNGQKPGAGSKGSTTNAGSKYTMDQIKAMSAQEVQADLANVNASLKVLSTK